MKKEIITQLYNAKVWVFDLDDTLYARSTGLSKEIDQRISAYIKKHLKLSNDEEVAKLRRLFRNDYGGALNGLRKNHGVNVAEYLHDVHTLDYSVLKHDKILHEALLNISARKYVFTNGDHGHALRSLAHLGLDNVFDGIFDINAANLLPKPFPETYALFLNHFAIDPRETVMVEDNMSNLAISKNLGMTTVLIDEKACFYETNFVMKTSLSRDQTSKTTPKIDHLPLYVDYCAPSSAVFLQNYMNYAK
ncbi:pyrimidine 5'-nucleotidase [Bartonella tamiae]|uniref:Pyrimidine 5'-nucleotidase n=1 Tax=Bartonella tamiae Th239 TaxID=1094558 RepID=J0R5S7_9HYPH|nr:pyrimidine 5'-nucleotidase [Bartonella tamiae]EJF91049.1 pyrimidine 5'-nucleotidase [Bartonella tamiae Th239]EJF93286.1 pyrimidine 5'-nucleotidase [Bartonella tamiae Th307]